ncbi:hypothetical protein CC86DRAFT_467287 [Ophiobolus disseminans]|uniref:Uncharacterized protein n=1 Tax=Ophiobolus disseminans TaxID=1469910 RepID=A0A6A6ZX28_9PLEO|nr:hypothetical protein CC86DRAFT_467287 [Ophiobolus disseminans]
MNQQMPNPPQGNFPNQPFQQPQNAGQQRPGANGPQKPVQGQQQMQNPSAKYNPPKLILFTLEKPRNVEGWDDVQPEQQRISNQDLQHELAKFRRNQGSAKRAFDEISSPSCRRLINDLVKEETEKLWEHNKSIQYTIVAVMNVSRWLDERKRRQELKRVQVILETEPSGFPDTQSVKPTAGVAGNVGNGGTGGGNAQGGQDMNKGIKQNVTGNQGQNMGQQPKNNTPQGNNMGQSQHFERPQGLQGGGPMHQGGAPPPPPPPPGGGGQHGGHLPPPPPMGGHQGGHPPPPPGVHHPHGNMMPNTFQGPIHMPAGGMRHGQPPIQVLDPRFSHHGKSKKNRRGESSSESGSEWESESGSSGSEPIRVRNVEHGTYGLVNKKDGRGRTKRSKGSKKSRRHRSQSQGVSRSRSHSKGPQRSSYRRRDSDSSDIRGRHSANSSGPNSPKLPPIHIHMGGNNSSGDERQHGHRKRREQRDSFHELPAGAYNKRKYDKKSSSHPMARSGSKDSKDSWQSWDRASDSSFATSSVNTGEDSIFDRPHGHRHSKSYTRAHHGSFTLPRAGYAGYDDPNRRDYIRTTRADDYPYSTSPPRGRDTYFKDPLTSTRPLPHRRATTQGYPPNPFDTLPRERIEGSAAYAYPADNRYPAPRQLRYSPETSPVRDRFKMDELADAVLDHIKKENQRERAPLRRHHTERGGAMEGDEWDEGRYQGRGRGYGGGYARY